MVLIISYVSGKILIEFKCKKNKNERYLILVNLLDMVT